MSKASSKGSPRESTDQDNNPQNWLDEYGDYLFRYALIRVSEWDIAEDLVQETFLAALKNHANFDGKGGIRTWLTSILKHKTMDYFRDIYKSGKINVDVASGDMDDFFNSGLNKGRWRPGHAPKDWSESTDNALHQKEFMQVLNDCLSELPERIASVFKLSELEDRGTGEICKELGITSTNFWVIMHRARTGLRRCLEIQWFDKTPADTTK